MKILMTGSSGFIGQFLTERLEKDHQLHHMKSDLRAHKEIYWLNSNNDLITKTLGYKPKVLMNEGLDQTIEIWKKKLS